MRFGDCASTLPVSGIPQPQRLVRSRAQHRPIAQHRQASYSIEVGIRLSKGSDLARLQVYLPEPSCLVHRHQQLPTMQQYVRVHHSTRHLC